MTTKQRDSDKSAVPESLDQHEPSISQSKRILELISRLQALAVEKNAEIRALQSTVAEQEARLKQENSQHAAEIDRLRSSNSKLPRDRGEVLDPDRDEARLTSRIGGAAVDQKQEHIANG